MKEIRSSFFDAPTDNIDVLNNRYLQQTVDISCDPNDVEDRLRSAVVMKRVRIEEFFHDYDKLRKGRVTKHQFHSILSQLNFNFTQAEYNALAARYETSDPERFFSYVDFCASINKAFTTKGIDKAPTATVAPLTQADTLLARRKYLQGTQTHEEGALAPVLENYRNEVARRRLNLKPQFQDYDRTRNGHVTKQQFLRVLDLLKISAPDHIVSALLRRYMDKGNVDEVNYVDFCEEVDGAVALYGVSQGHNHSFDYFEKTRPRQSEAEVVRNTPQDVEDVMARLRTQCSQNRVRLSEFMRDFDKLRTGFVTATQFRIALNIGKIQISNGEFKLLCDTFKAPKDGEHVRWKDFCDEVDTVFTRKGLEKNVDIVLGDARTATNYGRIQASEEEQAAVSEIVGQFTEFVRKNRLDAKSFFQDFDRMRHFKISAKIFRQVLTTHGFPLSEE